MRPLHPRRPATGPHRFPRPRSTPASSAAVAAILLAAGPGETGAQSGGTAWPDVDAPPQATAAATPATPAARTPRAARTDGIRLVDHPDRKELDIVLGPIDLPARTSHHALDQLPVQTATAPFDFTIRGYRVEIVAADGTRVPQIVLHHMNVLDPGSRELFLPIMRRVIAASHETPPVEVPGWLFGVPVRGGAEFLALAMLHNPTDRSYEDVEVRLTLQYERRERLPLYTLYPFHVDVMFPIMDTKAFDLPPGRTVRSWEGSPAVKSGIVGMGGHVHEHATRLTLRDLTTGETLYEVEPETSDEGRIEEVPVLTHGGRGIGRLIYPDHRYRVTVTYWNPTDRTIRDGGMGAIAGGVVPLEEWPAADPGDPLYRSDYEWVLRSLEHGEMEAPRGHGEHSHDGDWR